MAGARRIVGRMGRLRSIGPAWDVALLGLVVAHIVVAVELVRAAASSGPGTKGFSEGFGLAGIGRGACKTNRRIARLSQIIMPSNTSALLYCLVLSRRLFSRFLRRKRYYCCLPYPRVSLYFWPTVLPLGQLCSLLASTGTTYATPTTPDIIDHLQATADTVRQAFMHVIPSGRSADATAHSTTPLVAFVFALRHPLRLLASLKFRHIIGCG
ncbi:hypothetical protein C8J57DRAFT_1482168 [Mycena rebaudengoi]|nr:hypothetical protein C8J57DRAFT_1482168 [Mycena rebaudengoi]